MKKRKLHRRYGRAATTTAEWLRALRQDQALLKRMRRDLATIRRGGHVENLTAEGARSVIRALRATIANKRKMIGRRS